MTDYTGTEPGCKGRMLTGCRDGSHGWGCPLATPLEDVETFIHGAWPKSAVPASVPTHRPSRAMIAVGGRRSGKTHRMNVTKGIFILADLDKTAVDTAWADTKGLCWVCPVCASTDRWWQVQLCDGFDQPPRVSQEALVRAAAIEHMAAESETHDEWILDYLEMTDGEW